MKDKIVAEAARLCADAPRKNTKFAEEDFKLIIQSAIEKWQAYYETEILQLHITDRAQASETLEEQAARIRRTKVGCKGGVMAEGAHLEQHEFVPWDAGAACRKCGKFKEDHKPAQASEPLEGQFASSQMNAVWKKERAWQKEQTSKPWTTHTLLEIFNRTRAKDQPSRDQAICDAHNAIL